MQEIPKTQKLPILSHKNSTDIFGLPSRMHPGQIYLISGQSSLVGPIVQELIHHFAKRGELRVIVGANRFSLERLPIVLGEDNSKLHEILGRIKISRGETCYQLLHALQETENSRFPLMVLDMLDSFYEENLTDREVERVLADSLAHIKRLSANAPVLVSASLHSDRAQLLAALFRIAEHSIELKPERMEPDLTQLDLL